MTTDVGNPPALSVEGLTKRYPGTTALDEMTMEIRPHEIVGLVGENGAGKSTLLKSLIGLVQPDEGTIRVRGAQTRLGGITHAGSLGIGMVFQEQSLVPNITVAENILLGTEDSGVRFGFYHWRRLNALAQRQLDKIGLNVSPKARTDTLTFAQRQMVEIAKMLVIEERTTFEPIILLDEPTSVLEGDEIATLFSQIRRLRERASVVFVSHRLDEVLDISDRVYVLRGGKVVAEVDPKSVDPNYLHQLLIGHDSEGSHYHEGDQVDDTETPVRVKVDKLRMRNGTRISFAIRAGEVLGIAGVEGSGREEVCRALFGDTHPAHGEIHLDGKRVILRSPQAAVRLGIGYVPSERRSEGIVGPLSVAENMSLSHVSTVCRGPFLDPARERMLVDRWVDRLNIKTPSRLTTIETLSGGNQQKVVLARWMISPHLRLLILDHPTRGLDVGAKSEVYKLIRELVATGCSVLLLADTLEETIAMSHRVLIMKDGQIVSELDAPAAHKPSPLQIVEAML